MSQSNYRPNQNASTVGQPIVTEQGTVALPGQIANITQQNTGAATVIVVPPVVIQPAAVQAPPPQPPQPPAHPYFGAHDGGGHCGWHARHGRCRRRGRFFRFVFFLLLLGLGVAAVARFFNPVAVAFRGVHLDAEQRTQLRSIYFDATKNLHQERDALRKLQNQALELLRKENPNKKEIDGLIDAWVVRFKKIAQDRTDALLKAHSTLSSAQRHKLASNLERLRSRYERWRGRWNRRFHHPKACRH
ncbi:MAG: periplasmic heavy metal sensor [Myxococcales bacterium]|nr:periplasmic heavy metal sensor [Myxococcales bacterium]